MRFIILDGDVVTFMPTFGVATVVPTPTTISSTAAKETVTGRRPCLDGDESSVASPGCTYVTPQFSIPGSGTLKIQELGTDQLTKKTTMEGKKVILQGTVFKAVFEVMVPAAQPPPGPGSPIPDPAKSYPGGAGSFVPSNATVTAE